MTSSTNKSLSVYRKQRVTREESDKDGGSSTNVSFEQLPSEIQDVILSYLTFRERICCTVVCKSWRLAILSSPKTWHTLSNEGNRHNLSQVLLPYRDFIGKSDVRVIDLKLLYQGYAYTDVQEANLMLEETNQLLEFLAAIHCNSIEKATITLHVFSWPWIIRCIQATMHQSLTHLTLHCGMNATHSRARALPLTIMAIFQNLQCFCFILRDTYGTHVYLEDYFEEGREVHLEEPTLRHCQNLSTHHHLSTISLDISPRELRSSFPVDIIGRLPRLKHIRFTPDVFPSQILMTRFYEILHDYCPEIETLEYIYCIEDALLSEQSSSGHPNGNNSSLNASATKRGLKNVKLSAVHGPDDIMLHLGCIIKRHHTSLETIEICHLNEDHLDYLREFKFPSLKKLIFQSSEQRMLMHIWPDMSRRLIAFLDNAERLEHVELRLMRINDTFLEILSTRTTLRTLTIVGCVGVSSTALSMFQASSSANMSFKE